LKAHYCPDLCEWHCRHHRYCTNDIICQRINANLAFTGKVFQKEAVTHEKKIGCDCRKNKRYAKMEKFFKFSVRELQTQILSNGKIKQCGFNDATDEFAHQHTLNRCFNKKDKINN